MGSVNNKKRRSGGSNGAPATVSKPVELPININIVQLSL